MVHIYIKTLLLYCNIIIYINNYKQNIWIC